MNANSYSTPAAAGGNREDLSNTLTILEPEETPFVSLCPKGPGPKANFHEVLADTLRKPRTLGTREGSSTPKGGNKASKRKRFGAYLHRWHDTYGVTDVQQAISKVGGTAGVEDEFSYDKAKCTREMKRDIESTACSSIETQGGSDDEMQLRGAFTWLAPTNTPQVPADFVPPAAQRLTGVATIIETGANSLNSVLKSMKTQYGMAKEFQMILGSDYAEQIDLFTRTDATAGASSYRYRVQQAKPQEVELMVKVFKSTFGRVNMIPSEFLRIDATTGLGNATSALILNMDLWYMGFLEELHAVDEEPDAGGETGYQKAIGGLWCKMPKGNASIYNT